MTSTIKTGIYNGNSLQNTLGQKVRRWKTSLRNTLDEMNATMNEYLSVSQKFWYRHPF